MKQQITAVGIIALVCVGVGIGAGMLIMKPKLAKSASAVEEMQLQMMQSKAESEDVIKRAVDQVTQLKAELARASSAAAQYKNDLARAAMEIDRLKTAGPRPAEGQTTPAAVPAGTPASPAAAPAAGSAASAPRTAVAAVDYVVKDGDSFWKIAAAQLGSGIRYKEILALNPQLKEDSTLVVGSKIKIPAK
ncbi:MAG: LysM peptidoglycan-binding domain-containing protein [Planctomycetales bacterium]|nr:LysM peptidoglycan-binding domain-containing protein [Planctomycetales bacterium]